MTALGTAAVKTASNFDSAMSKVAAASFNANTNVSMLGGESFKYCAPIAGAKTAFSTLGAAIGGISAPVVAVVAIIATLIAAFVHLWNTN